uniref:Uncharacterized protein n=1 Tax=Arundo donax TaxID=35708 RepID=A0A0A8Y8F1_ARUDO
MSMTPWNPQKARIPFNLLKVNLFYLNPVCFYS